MKDSQRVWLTVLAFVHGKVMRVDKTRGHVYQKQSQEMVLDTETLVIASAALRER